MLATYTFGGGWVLPLHLVLVGFLPLVLAGASLLGSIFGGAGRGAANERTNRNTFTQGENNRTAQMYGMQQNALAQLLGLDERATMDRSRLGLDAPGQRTRQAILGSILQNLQPMRIQAPSGIRMGNVTGGLSPALLNPQARQAGSALQSQALQALLSGSDVPPPTNYAQRGLLPTPQMQGYQQPGRFENLASILGLIGAGAGGAQTLWNQYQQGQAARNTPMGAG